MTHHFHNLHFRLNAQMVEEGLQVLLHLDWVVLHLRHSEDAQLAILPCAVLTEEEWQQHKETAVMDDPPDVDCAYDLREVRETKGDHEFMMK